MKKGAFTVILSILLMIIIILSVYLLFLWMPAVRSVFSPTDSVVESPENSSSIEPVDKEMSLPSSDNSSGADLEESLPPAEPPVLVPKRADRSEALTFHDFYQAGISCQVVYEPNAHYSYGEVISVEFNGTEDDCYYYIQKKDPVILHISSAAGETADTYADRIIYLTFDDGPSYYTSELLDLLASYHVPATFFTVGCNVDAYPEQVRAICENGHALGCHSYTHRYADCYASADALEAEIRHWESSVSSIIGQRLPYRLFRYPGGSSTGLLPKENYTPIQERLTAMGYYSFDWTCANCDKWLTPKREDQTDREYFEAQVRDTITGIETYHPNRPRIMLLHETVEETRHMMSWIIEYLSAKGYAFRTLTQLQESYYF